MKITKEEVERGDFKRLHCERCDWPWHLHQDDASALARITHEFVIPADILENEPDWDALYPMTDEDRAEFRHEFARNFRTPDWDAIMTEVLRVCIKRGYLMNVTEFQNLVRHETDKDRVCSVVNDRALGYIAAELGPDEHGSYWLDHASFHLMDKFSWLLFEPVNNGVLAVYRSGE